LPDEKFIIIQLELIDVVKICGIAYDKGGGDTFELIDLGKLNILKN